MLATDADLTKLRFPLLASAKLDGIRAIVRGGVVYSRSNKPIPNKFVQDMLNSFEYFDGELIVGVPNSKTVYRDTVSHVMSHDKTNYDLRFYVFDHIQHMDRSYNTRSKGILNLQDFPMLTSHKQHFVSTLEGLLTLEEEYLERGYEGLILRDPEAPYKNGRSTAKEGILLKMKRFVDDEATVIGFEERLHNGSEKVVNELGRGQRSSHSSNKTGRNDLGAIQVEFNGVKFSIGTGFADDERRRVWDNRASYLGALAKFKYFPIGIKDAPRHPVFLGWRDAADT